ncbi:MAG TPA: ATP-dependent 6-phosphofructokinase [Methylomirabilota bacterium]|nr:ATP-dependent 6-phosphofructokinase [Methylomirabilota bacterium]
MPAPRHIAVVTAGGDCPGMNAALRAVVRAAVHRHGMRVTGFHDGFAGLLTDQCRPLGFDEVSGIVAMGGTMLGASNRDDPFRVPVDRAGAHVYEDRSDAVLATIARHGIEGLVVIGGDGSLSIARRLEARGVPVVGIPKTIDNDVAGTDVTLGFDSALTIATEAVDRLHTTAASHHRVMVLEVMGRNAGWIALEAGLAGGGDVILIPELPFRYDAVAVGILDRARRGRRFSIVVVAEGARCPGGGTVVRQVVEDSPDPVRLGGVCVVLAHALEALVPFEVRHVALGHVQRGGSPTAFDRMLATRFGAAAVAALADGKSDCMVALKSDRIERVPLADVLANPKRVDPQGERVTAARAIGTIFGDEDGVA